MSNEFVLSKEVPQHTINQPAHPKHYAFRTEASLNDLYLFTQGQPFELAYQSVIGIFLILSGLGILIASVRVFRKVGTTVNPVDPDQASMLVVEGPFTFSRNPMYLGTVSYTHLTLPTMYTG